MADSPGTPPGSGTPHRRGLIGRAVGVVAPAVVRQIDANDLVDAIDVNVIAADLDLDRLVARLDVNQIAQRLDLDALIDRLDVNQVAERLDLDALVDRLDVNQVAQRLDLDALVDRLDVNQVAQGLDLDALVARLDLNLIAEQLDLDALVDRLDVNHVAERLDMAKITAGATQDVAVSGLDLVRRQLVRADATVDSVVGRLLRRKPGSRPEAPGRLAEQVGSPSAQRPDDRELQRRDVSGHYAGPVTRLLGLVGDALAAVGLQAAFAWVLVFFLGLLFDVDTSSVALRWAGVVAVGSVFVAYFWIPVALFGRTPAMALLGIAVVRRDGGDVNSRRALVRALVLPVSILIPVLLLGMVLGKERRALQDVMSGTIEVYDWGEREAEQPVTIRQQLSARVRRRKLSRSG